MSCKAYSPESITTGMCHDVIVYNFVTQQCTSVLQWCTTVSHMYRYKVCIFVIIAAWI